MGYRWKSQEDEAEHVLLLAVPCALALSSSHTRIHFRDNVASHSGIFIT